MENYLTGLADARWYLKKKKSENPFVEDYELEIDETPSLQQYLAYWYQSLIEMIRWMVEIVRVDIITDVLIVASHLVMPRK